ncbi:MAG: PilZ domain-containing protein, partial [Hyphomicrobiales bacterium]|nr:PilZ domain-containing protein [Hyphomicrobiales bacterium]
ERRASPREPLRLRSAKLLDAAYRFVCECRVCDRSQHGLRLVLARNYKASRRLAVHIDETREVRAAKIVWRRGPMLGVRLGDRIRPGAIKPWDRYALRERYYGILD